MAGHDFSDKNAPSVVKIEAEIWNENEFKFSGTSRCASFLEISELEQLEQFCDQPLRRSNLGTESGKARLNGTMNATCEDSVDDAALLMVHSATQALVAWLPVAWLVPVLNLVRFATSRSRLPKSPRSPSSLARCVARDKHVAGLASTTVILKIAAPGCRFLLFGVCVRELVRNPEIVAELPGCG